MKTLTTIEAGKLMFACPNDERLDLRGVVTLTNLNESEQVNLTEDELSEFEGATGHKMESDTVPQESLWALQSWLYEEDILEPETPASPVPDNAELIAALHTIADLVTHAVESTDELESTPTTRAIVEIAHAAIANAKP